MEISYEYYMEHYKKKFPKFTDGDTYIWTPSGLQNTIKVRILKPIDFDTEQQEWRYQAISTISNEHCFVWEHELEKIN